MLFYACSPYNYIDFYLGYSVEVGDDFASGRVSRVKKNGGEERIVNAQLNDFSKQVADLRYDL